MLSPTVIVLPVVVVPVYEDATLNVTSPDTVVDLFVSVSVNELAFVCVPAAAVFPLAYVISTLFTFVLLLIAAARSSISA